MCLDDLETATERVERLHFCETQLEKSPEFAKSSVKFSSFLCTKIVILKLFQFRFNFGCVVFFDLVQRTCVGFTFFSLGRCFFFSLGR
jgi:hypothetical protein